MTREEIEAGLRHAYSRIYDWDAMRERLTDSLSRGTWTQNAMTLGPREQARIGWRLVREYVLRGSAAQRRFFFSVLATAGQRVNKESIVNTLLMAINWNDFAYALEPEPVPGGEPLAYLAE